MLEVLCVCFFGGWGLWIIHNPKEEWTFSVRQVTCLMSLGLPICL